MAYPLSFCLSFHTRINVSNRTSTAWDTTSEISRPMSRGFLNMLLCMRLRDWATVAFVSLFTSWGEQVGGAEFLRWVDDFDVPQPSSLCPLISTCTQRGRYTQTRC